MISKSSSNKVPAFVLGLSVTGLATLRALHQAGIEVLGFDSEKGGPGRFSRYAKTFDAPAPETEADALLEELLRFAPDDCRPVLIPASDAHLLFMSRHRAELEKAFVFSLPGEAVTEAMVDKRLQYVLAKQHGIACPQTIFAEDHQALLRQAQQIAFPVFLKPAQSHLWRPIFHNKRLRLEGLAELERALDKIAPHDLAVTLQRIIPGPATNHFEVCAHMDRRGEALAVFTTRKLRQWSVDFGIGTLLESSRHPELEGLSVAFLKAIGFKGTAAIEFKQDAKTGEFLMIEVNGRLWSDHSLAVHCGINYPLLAYLDLVGPPPQPITDYPKGVRWLDGASDLWASLTLMRQGLLGPMAWLASFSGTRSFAYFDAADPLPFLAETAKVPQRLLAYSMRYILGGAEGHVASQKEGGGAKPALTPPPLPPPARS
jgi:D-aspartate ligase